VLNLYWETLGFKAPVGRGRRWHRIVDTARPSPDDIVESDRQTPIEGNQVQVKGPSALALLSR
jgi:isoamylase